jgi:hypothetical protein
MVLTVRKGKGGSSRLLRHRLPQVAGQRGMVALFLGIIGLAGTVFSCCFPILFILVVCSALAWTMGGAELRMYRALEAVGREESQARAGYVLGIIGMFVALLPVAVWTLYVVFVATVFIYQDMQQSGIRLILTGY